MLPIKTLILKYLKSWNYRYMRKEGRVAQNIFENSAWFGLKQEDTEDTERWYAHIKGALSGLRQFLATESP